MYLEYRVDNDELQDAWLQTLLNMVDELSCKYQMFFEEGYSTKKNASPKQELLKLQGLMLF